MPKISNIRMKYSLNETKKEMFGNIEILTDIVNDLDIVHSIISKIDYYVKIKWTFGCLPNGFLDEYIPLLDTGLDKWILRDIIQKIGKEYFILTENDVYFNVPINAKIHPE